MADYVIMPKLGFNMDKGELLAWLKAEGDVVTKGDLLFEIQTDKTAMGVEAALSGVLLKILVPPGNTVPVTLPVAVIGTPGEDIGPLLAQAGVSATGSGHSAPAPDALSSATPEFTMPEKTPQQQTHPKEPGSNASSRFTPRALKYIQEHRLDISSLVIQGTGYEGGVTEKNIIAHLATPRQAVSPLAKKTAAAAGLDVSDLHGSGQGGKIMRDDVLAALSQTQAPAGPIAILRSNEYAGIRKVIGERLSQSKLAAPHVYFSTSVDMEALILLRGQINHNQAVPISFNDFIVAAVARALHKHPEINCALHGNQVLYYSDINIGVAVALENGLIVPVIKQAQHKKLAEIAETSRALTQKARQGSLLPDEYQGGTFTVSNLGMFGIEHFTAIINPPEAAILAVSAAKKHAVVMDDAQGQDVVAIRTLMQITLSADHRLIDGLTATKFINTVKSFLETPLSILV